jgi:putative transposase
MQHNFNQDIITCDGFYHVSFSGKQNEILFPSDEYYLHFLKLFFTNILPIADVYSYCLLPNQFQFLLKVKSEKTVFTYFKIEGRFPEETITLEEIKALSEKAEFNSINILSIHIKKQFTQFFNAYAKELFTQKLRKDKLLGPFQTRRINPRDEMQACIANIHTSAVAQKFMKDLSSWKYNS